MPTYKAPVEEVVFLLREVVGYQGFAGLPGFADAPLDTVEAILREGARFSEEVLQPINQTGDRQGCRLENGVVRTPDGFASAYAQFVEGGWNGLSADTAFGGQGLPATLSASINEFVTSANMAFGMYPGLTAGAIAALSRHGSDAQKRTYLPNMIAGTWSGTMNLTEAHCGTDLGLLRAKATPEGGDGGYRITGTKIFISAGEHDLTENIVHLVLARIDGAPAGTKGISLFVVPKVLVNQDGSLGSRNAVACGALEEKMGIHGNATCVMNYDGAAGWLVGEENRGLAAMFTMMNEARLGVAIQGLALSEVAYQNAAIYARERRQGRALTGPAAPAEAADPIIVHADIRRILMKIKGFNQAARALVLWTALKGDVAARSADEKARAAAEEMMGLLTPVLKGVLTDTGFANTVEAQQVYGGHGYIADNGMEQFVRDARITQIYEGANGVQAMDLVGRKLPRDGGRALMAFVREVDATIAAGQADEAVAPLANSLKAGRDALEKASLWFMQNAMAKPDNAGAGATDYMHLMGLVALGMMSCKIALAARAGAAGGDMAMRGRLVAARCFMERTMPEAQAHLARITAGSDSLMELPAEAF